jgi:hypothetical protein
MKGDPALLLTEMQREPEDVGVLFLLSAHIHGDTLYVEYFSHKKADFGNTKIRYSLG